MNKPANPRWAVAATGLLLALSTGMAALVAHNRTAASIIQLGESKSYAGLGLRTRLPIDWEIAAAQQTDLGQMLVAVQPGEKSDRELVLFRAKPILLGMMAVSREDAVRKAIDTAMPNGRIVHSSLVGTSKIGSLTSEVYQILVLTQRLKTWGLANVATGPGRQTFGVVILVGDQLSIRDQKLLEEISQSVSLEGTNNQPATPAKPGKPMGIGVRRQETEDTTQEENAGNPVLFCLLSSDSCLLIPIFAHTTTNQYDSCNNT